VISRRESWLEKTSFFRVSANGAAGDWYWEVVFDRNIRRSRPHEDTSPRAGPEGCGIPRGPAARGIPRQRSKVSRLYRHLEDFDAPLIDD
jgi:hypothetical protein